MTAFTSLARASNRRVREAVRRNAPQRPVTQNGALRYRFTHPTKTTKTHVGQKPLQ